jgi:hypothetical protein
MISFNPPPNRVLVVHETQLFPKIKKQVVNDADVKSFLNEHQSELTNEIIDNDLNVI